MRFVRAGTLDEPTAVAPDVHIYTRSKVAWVTLPEGTPAFEEYYDEKELWPAESLRRLEVVSRPYGKGAGGGVVPVAATGSISAGLLFAASTLAAAV